MSKSFVAKIRAKTGRRGRGWDKPPSPRHMMTIADDGQDYDDTHLHRHEALTSTIRHGGRGERANGNYLRRWLRERAGQPWDAVFSGLVTQARTLPEHIQEDIRSKLRWYVTMPSEMQGRGWRPWRGDLYVDEQGLLRVGERSGRQDSPPPETTLIRLGPGVELRLVDGIWYEFRSVWREADEEVLPTATGGFLSFIHGGRWDEVSKRALSHKALKRHGLKNDLV